MTLTVEQIDLRKQIIARGIGENKSLSDIASNVGISYSGIKHFCKKHNISIVYNRKCRQCGKSFSTKEPLKEFCSELCENRSRPKNRYAHECERCGLFFMSTSGHTKLCRSCFYITHQVHTTSYHPICVQCGKHFTGRINARFCSEKCRQVYVAKKPSEATCIECGRWFKTTRNGAKYCSNTCCRRHSSRANEFRRRILITGNGSFDTDISIDGIIARDGMMCALCGKPVDMSDYVQTDTAFIAGNNYPSIDHVVPLARGGKHVWNNLQLAHRVCNSSKGAR